MYIGKNQSGPKLHLFDKDKLKFLQNSIAFEYLTDFLPFLPFLVKFTEFQTHVGPLDFWVLVILEV